MYKNWFYYKFKGDKIHFEKLTDKDISVEVKSLKNHTKKSIIGNVFTFNEEDIYEFTVYGEDISIVTIPYYNKLLKELMEDYIKILCKEECNSCGEVNKNKVLVKTGFFLLTTGFCFKNKINDKTTLKSYEYLKDILNKEFLSGDFKDEVYEKKLIQLLYLVLKDKYSQLMDSEELERIFQYNKVKNCLGMLDNCVNIAQKIIKDLDYKEVVNIDRVVLKPYHFPFYSLSVNKLEYVRIISYNGDMRYKDTPVYKGQIISMLDIEQGYLVIELKDLNINIMDFQWESINN